ncbi:MAG TPA: hypothetical protein VHR88_11875 [Solirubrobacteraceae bacterium]|nr:hypothetical protein [Solirubrobacteraceae bacterium]
MRLSERMGSWSVRHRLPAVGGWVAFLQQVGAGLAAAVLIDATIVRGVLLPSVMTPAGDANWYLPGVRGRRAERTGLAPDPRRA